MDLLGEIKLNALQIIQLMIAPAVMISACGLLLLSLNNRYSMVVNRIRLLNDEKRKLMKSIADDSHSTDDNIRLESLANQIQSLVIRGRLVRNSVLSYTIAIGLFVLTSLLLGISSVMSLSKLNFFVLISFMSGMISIFAGVVFTMLEAKKGYDIILYEVVSHD